MPKTKAGAKPTRSKSAVSKRNSSAARLLSSKPWVLLLALFALFAAVRYGLSCALSAGPTVYIDEGLYINIARSLASDGRVLYRAQPISYVYLLYPFALLPIFWLPAGVNVYRAIQLWNAILISSSVFPAYLTGRKLRLSKERACAVAAITLLIPEMCLSTQLIAESLIYPMMLWSFYLAVCAINRREKLALSVLLGGVTGVSYFAKPGCIVFGLCTLGVLLVYGIAKKEKKTVVSAGSGLCTAGLLVGGGYLLYNVCFGYASALNLYEKQIPTVDLQNILIMLQALLFHLIAVMISSGGAFVLVPAMGSSLLKTEDKITVRALLTAIFASCVGVAVMIAPYKYNGTFGVSIVHMRYLIYYAPFLITLLFLPELEAFRFRKANAVLLAICTLFFILPSGYRMFNSWAGAFDAPSLNAYNAERAGYVWGVLLIVVLVSASAYLIYAGVKKGWNRKLRTLACVMTAVSFLFNGVAAYRNVYSIDPAIEADASKVATAMAEEEYVLVTTNLYDDIRGYQLEAHLHKPAQMVVVNNMLLDAVETGGVYRSYVPLVQSPNVANEPLIDTDTLLFDITVADYIEFADGVTVKQSPGGLYTIAKFTPGKPYLRSAIASMDGFTLNSADVGSLLVYDAALLERGYVTLTISLRSQAAESCTVTFESEGESKTVTATRESHTYEITLPMTQNGFYHFTIKGSDDIVINEYKTE